MAGKFGFFGYFFVLGFVIEEVILVPTSPSADSSIQELESRLLEVKLPVQFEDTNDLIAWVRNAMRSMASRIDITLATVDEPEVENRESSSSSSSEKRLKQRDSIVTTKSADKRPDASSGALVTTYASLFGAGNSFASIAQDQNNLVKDFSSPGNTIIHKNVSPRRENDFISAYLPLILDDLDISKFRDEALRKYYLEIEQSKDRETSKTDLEDKTAAKHSRAIAHKASQVIVDNDEVKTNLSRDLNQERKLSPVISVPFEAVVTITRENLPEPPLSGLTESRDPPDEFPPYFEREYPRREGIKNAKLDKPKKIKENSQKQQIGALGDLLRTIGLTRKLITKPIGPANSAPTRKAKKPSTIFTPPPQFQFEDEPQRQRRNETSQKQEFEDEDEDYEEPMGSLGSITDLLPLVIPILEDILDPETETDLGEVLAAALPLIQGLSDPDDADAPDIIGMIGPILTNILGGKDGQGSDVAAILRPLVTLVAPLIGPVLGPLVGPALTASSNPPDGNGSSLATLINAVVGPLVQPIGDGKQSPLSVFTAGLVATLSKQLMPGAPGGLDIGALIGAILSGIISGASAGLSGSLSEPSYNEQPYLPYGPGPVQAGSINTGFHAPGSQQPNRGPGNSVDRQRIVNNPPTRRPYSSLPQKLPPGPHPRPPNYVQPGRPQGPYQAGTMYAATEGGSSYLPYGNNAVAANSVNPIAVIGTAVKDVLSAGIQVVSSVINAVFGIIGGSSGSGDDAKPVYGPPPQSYAPPAQGYSQSGR